MEKGPFVPALAAKNGNRCGKNVKSVAIVTYRFVWTWFRVDFSKLDLHVREMDATFFR
jgi:hypothetical protein